MVELRASDMASGNGRSASARLVADWWDGDRRRGGGTGSCSGPATSGSPLPAPPGGRCSATCSIVGASVVTLLAALVAVPNCRSLTGPGWCCNMLRLWNDLVVPCWFSLTVGPDTDIFCDDASCKGGGGGTYWEGWVWAELSSCGMGMTVVPSFTVSTTLGVISGLAPYMFTEDTGEGMAAGWFKGPAWRPALWLACGCSVAWARGMKGGTCTKSAKETSIGVPDLGKVGASGSIGGGFCNPFNCHLPHSGYMSLTTAPSITSLAGYIILALRFSARALQKSPHNLPLAVRISAGKSSWIANDVPFRNFDRPNTACLALKSRNPAMIGLGRQGWPLEVTPLRGRPSRWTRWNTMVWSCWVFSCNLCAMKSNNICSHCSSVSLGISGIFMKIKLLRLARASKSTTRNSAFVARSFSMAIWTLMSSTTLFVLRNCWVKVSTTDILSMRKFSFSESDMFLTSSDEAAAYVVAFPSVPWAVPPVLLLCRFAFLLNAMFTR